MAADEVKNLLGLTPHPRVAGCDVRTCCAGEMLASDAFEDRRYAGPRFTGTAIY